MLQSYRFEQISLILLNFFLFQSSLISSKFYKEIGIIFIMKIRSPHFKKEYDISKAEMIGQGNFAQVYRVFDSDINDFVAIRKVKKTEADLQDINKQKIINEQLRKVDNENILKIYDIIDNQQSVWYITEYCSGGSLWDVLNLCKDNRMNEKDGLETVLQISKGIQELHNHRITHRDLKPQNILLKTKYSSGKTLPQVKLADFGLSTQKIIMETIAGTKQYIAPEQAKFHNYTNAVDVWSLGIICDQILHGNPFYSGQNNKQVFSKILKQPYKVRDENLRTPIKELLVSLLKKKPYERPIIGVIRKTIEKIIEEIEEEKKQKKNKSRQNGISSLKTSKNESVNNSSSNLIQSRKKYQVSLEEKQKEKQKVEINSISPRRQGDTPLNKKKPVGNYFNRSSNDEKISEKNNSRVKNSSNQKQSVITINNIRQKKQVKKQTELELNMEAQIIKTDRSEKNLPKLEKNTPNSKNQIVNEKISVYKIDPKKRFIPVSHVKKEEVKPDILDIKVYIEKMSNLKKGLIERNLKFQPQRSFVPNSFLSASQYTEKADSCEQILKNFKKKMDFLNYFNSSEDYEIKLLRGQRELVKNRDEAEDQLININNSIKQTFLSQMDNFVDSYLQKVLK